MMKKNLFATAILSVVALAGFAQQLPVATYEQAVKSLGFNANRLVYNSNVNPTWLADGKFWYSINTASGNQFVLINPVDGSRKTAADVNISGRIHS
ncbi:MAG TPA: S9 family peptidase, partial [Haliscomenobacter sp.]|nr:S9 family peptidase [Haliscomenobacter sp.]